MENTVTNVSAKKAATKDFMIVAVCSIALYFLYLISSGIAGIVMGAIGIADKPYAPYLGIIIPLHLITAPIIYFAFRDKKGPGIEKKSISPLTLIGIIPIIYTAVFVGSNISSGISFLLNDTSAKAVAAVTTGDSDFWRILVVGICAPIVEEFLFRKLLIDRMAKHSQICAVIFSSVAFGLFHMNITQFFYATFIGIILGFVYVKTGKIIYTIILHMVVNLATSVIASNLIKLENQLPLQIYSAVLVLLAIVGVILFIVKYRKFVKLQKNENLSTGKAAVACFLNPVSIVYYVIAFGMILINTIAMIQ